MRERQPFGGPLLVSFPSVGVEYAIGGQLARAMRVQLEPDPAPAWAVRERIVRASAKRGAARSGEVSA